MMKTLFTALAALICLPTLVWGQMDDKFYYPDKQWNGITGVEYEDIFLVSEGDTVHSVILNPAGRPKADILYFHGNGSNMSKWAADLMPLVKDGFRVTMTDYRGYGRSTGRPTHVAIAKDAQMLFDTLTTRAGFGENGIIIYGSSIGTQVASKIAEDNNELITGLVLDGMMASFTDVAVATSPPEQAALIRQYVPSPYSAKESVPLLRDIKLLVIHSAEDTIPISGAKEVYESATVSKSFWQYEGPHVMAPVLFPDELVRRINLLLQE